jgi:flagellum-specific ATP synthase
MTVFAEMRTRTLGKESIAIVGRVQSIAGIALRAAGLEYVARIGQWCRVSGNSREILGEIVASDDRGALLLPFGDWRGVAAGDRVELLGSGGTISPDDSWIGCVVDAFGRPLVAPHGVSKGDEAYPTKASPPPAFSRRPVGAKIETQIKCVDVFTPICQGQRLGIFAGSGVGKSTLMAMLARNTDADVVVIAMVGERGRELQEFINNDLGEEGLARSVVVVSTGDEAPLQRRQAAYTATTVAEYFRKSGRSVLFLFDSITRFAMAQREIGLASGEPPTTKGYPPTVYSELSQLLERTGPGINGEGDITGVYTVLVDGDDFNEPISDAVRGILDGHIILERHIAEQNRYPAVNIQKSISRMLPNCHSAEEFQIMSKARLALSRYADMEDLIRVGAYRPGSDAKVDSAIAFFKEANVFLGQRKSEKIRENQSFAEIYRMLTEAGIVVELEQVSPETTGNPDSYRLPTK